MIHSILTTELEGQQGSLLPAITAALLPIDSIAWNTAQHFSYGARGFYARPSERSERLELFVRPSALVLFHSFRNTVFVILVWDFLAHPICNVLLAML